MSDLLSRLRLRLSDPNHIHDGADVVAAVIYPTCDSATIYDAESKLGFALPSILRSLYMTIGNGGYGPGYGLLGIGNGATADKRDVIATYNFFREDNSTDSHWKWPAQLLPVTHLGCGMYGCLDCRDERGAVVWFEPNPHEDGTPWDTSFIPVCETFERWLEMWLDDVDWMDLAWRSKFGVGLDE